MRAGVCEVELGRVAVLLQREVQSWVKKGGEGRVQKSRDGRPEVLQSYAREKEYRFPQGHYKKK